ncbi:hypothetical protein [uncultured Mediterranean phage uvMED]|nr:hypothetical protein [uncultured Mediterranean phage uvMED]
MASVNDLLNMQMQGLLMQPPPSNLSLLSQALGQANNPNIPASGFQRVASIPGLLAQNMANNRKLQQQQVQDLLSLNKTIMDTNLLQQQVREAELKNKLFGQLVDPSNPMMQSQRGGVNPTLAILFPNLVEAMQKDQKFVLDEKIYKEQPVQQAKIEAAKTQAKFKQEAKQSFPKNYQKYENIMNSIDGLLESPGLDELVGRIELISAGEIKVNPGSDLANAYERLQQIKGQTFLQAFTALKGGGQITEFESQEAQKSLGRLNTAQKKEDFVASLNDLKKILSEGILLERFNAGYQNLPKGALPLGYMEGSKNPFILINGSYIEMPSVTAKYMGEAVRDGKTGFVFQDKGKTFFVTP